MILLLLLLAPMLGAQDAPDRPAPSASAPGGAAATAGPSMPNVSPFQDALVDQLNGPWTATGIAGDHPLSERVFGTWVLHHQFLRLYTQESTIHYESDLYIGYDSISDRYVAHLLDVFGGRSSETLGYGLRSGDQIQIVFDRPSMSARHTLTWNAKDATWLYLVEVKDHSGKWHTASTKTMKRMAGGRGGRDGIGRGPDGRGQ